MASNEDYIRERYSKTEEDKRAYGSRANGLEFYFTKKLLEKYISKQSKVIEVGCGTGYYGMFLYDKCKEYVGLDLSPDNINVFNEKIKKEKIKNILTMVGDATNLSQINNDEFDVVLVLGPMYHLPPEERDLVFKEAKRICKDEGIIMFAYINKLGVYLQDGILTDTERYPNKFTNECVLEKEISDDMPGLFFFTTSGKIGENAESNGLEIIKNLGVKFSFNKDLINNMDDEKYQCFLEFSEYLCNDESCTGLSSHSILICKK
jgi:ubiquinone/menaquinone biosynthesis C-methylase UbiE